MQNFIKTIINAFKHWTNDKINSVVTDKINNSVADWDQNDPSADNYIKNRPFYTEKGSLVTILPKTTLTFTSTGYSGSQFIYDDDDADGTEPINRLGLIEGKTYLVLWDNIEYRCNCTSYSGESIGNKYLISNNEIDSGEPFFIWYDTRVITDTIGTHTLEIAIINDDTIHKLDSKYLDLPTNLATIDDVQEAIDVANTAQNTANTAQNTANTAVTDAATAQTIANSKMDKNNPSGSGTFSLNSNNLIGDYSINLAYQGVASSMYETTTGAYNKAKYGYRTGEQTWVHWNNSNGIKYAESFSQDPNTGIFSLVNPQSGLVRDLVAGVFVLGGNNTVREIVYAGSPSTTSQKIYYIPYISNFATGSRGDYIHIVGNGTSDTARSNAHTLDWNGNAWYQGDVYVGGTDQGDANRLLNESEIATEEDIMDMISELGAITPVTMSDGSIVTSPTGEIYTL